MGSLSNNKISVIILGGGIAGITLLRGLLQHPHLDPVVYEATQCYRDVGGGMALHKNAIGAMQSIDPAIKDSYFRNANSMAADDEIELSTHVIMVEGHFSGEILARLGTAKGRKTISRYDLLNGWFDLVPKDRVHFGKRSHSLEELSDGRVRCFFEDGTSVTGDCVIAADGIHSKSRQFLLPRDHPAAKPVNHDGWLSINRQIPMEHALKVLKGSTEYVRIMIGPRGYISTSPLHKGKTLSLTLMTTGKATPKDLDVRLQHSYWDGYDSECLGVVSLMASGSGPDVYWNLADHDRAPIYHRNNVVMIGDAGEFIYSVGTRVRATY
jgi:salicylate hydroxylase